MLFESAEVSKDEIHYRGRGDRQEPDPHSSGHSVESRALVVFLLDVPGHKSMPSKGKKASLDMVTDLVKQSVRWGGVPIWNGAISFNCFDPRGNPATLTWSFNGQGLTADLANLEAFSSTAARLWKKLIDVGWQGQKITSTLELASLWDVMFFVSYTKHNQASSDVWKNVCQHIYPELVYVTGSLMANFACHLGTKPLEEQRALPLLKSQAGNTRSVPKLNKLLLLKRLESQRRHRREVMMTHTDLTSKDIGLIRHVAGLNDWHFLASTFCFALLVAFLTSCL